MSGFRKEKFILGVFTAVIREPDATGRIEATGWFWRL